MSKAANQLDAKILNTTLFSLEDLKVGTQYEAIITDVNYSYSQPL
jgi:hypothetical protein